MDSHHLPDMAAELLTAARDAAHGRSAKGIVGGHGHLLRQVVMALTAGNALAEHDSPDEATLHVLQGRVVLTAGDVSWEGAAGDLLVIPRERHDLKAVEDAVFILTVGVAQH